MHANQKPKFPSRPDVLTVTPLLSSFTSTMVKNGLKSNARSALSYLTFIAGLLTKLNSGVPIATMPYSFGSIVKIAPFINAIMTNARLLSTISASLIPSRKLYVKQNPLSSNFIINIANIILPMSNSNILPLTNPALSSTSAIL